MTSPLLLVREQDGKPETLAEYRARGGYEALSAALASGRPDDVTKAYELLQQGAQLVHSTATKYTLVGKIDEAEQKKLGADLMSGCEMLGAATLSGEPADSNIASISE